VQGAGTASNTPLGIHLAIICGEDNTSFDDGYGLLGAIQEASLAAGTDLRIDMGLGALLLALLGRAVSLGVNDGPIGAGVKTCATFLTEVGIYIKANLDLAVNGVFRAPLGTGTAPLTIFTDLIGHEKKESGKRL